MTSPETFKCFYCATTFQDAQGVMNHMARHCTSTPAACGIGKPSNKAATAADLPVLLADKALITDGRVGSTSRACKEVDDLLAKDQTRGDHEVQHPGSTDDDSSSQDQNGDHNMPSSRCSGSLTAIESSSTRSMQTTATQSNEGPKYTDQQLNVDASSAAAETAAAVAPQVAGGTSSNPAGQPGDATPAPVSPHDTPQALGLVHNPATAALSLAARSILVTSSFVAGCMSEAPCGTITHRITNKDTAKLSAMPCLGGPSTRRSKAPSKPALKISAGSEAPPSTILTPAASRTAKQAASGTCGSRFPALGTDPVESSDTRTTACEDKDASSIKHPLNDDDHMQHSEATVSSSKDPTSKGGLPSSSNETILKPISTLSMPAIPSEFTTIPESTDQPAETAAAAADQLADGVPSTAARTLTAPRPANVTTPSPVPAHLTVQACTLEQNPVTSPAADDSPATPECGTGPHDMSDAPATLPTAPCSTANAAAASTSTPPQPPSHPTFAPQSASGINAPGSNPPLGTVPTSTAADPVKQAVLGTSGTGNSAADTTPSITTPNAAPVSLPGAASGSTQPGTWPFSVGASSTNGTIGSASRPFGALPRPAVPREESGSMLFSYCPSPEQEEKFTSPAVFVNYCSISAARVYNNKSAEELRWEDYQGGVKHKDSSVPDIVDMFDIRHPKASLLFASPFGASTGGFSFAQAAACGVVGPLSHSSIAPSDANTSAASTNAASTCTGLPVGSAAATNAATAHAPSTASAADAAWTSATGIATSGASWTQPPTSDWGVSRHNTFGSSDIGMYNASFLNSSSAGRFFGSSGGLFGSTSMPSAPSFTPRVFGGTSAFTGSFGSSSFTPSVFGRPAAFTGLFGSSAYTPSVFNTLPGRPCAFTGPFGSASFTPSVFGAPGSDFTSFGAAPSSTFTPRLFGSGFDTTSQGVAVFAPPVLDTHMSDATAEPGPVTLVTDEEPAASGTSGGEKPSRLDSKLGHLASCHPGDFDAILKLVSASDLGTLRLANKHLAGILRPCLWQDGRMMAAFKAVRKLIAVAEAEAAAVAAGSDLAVVAFEDLLPLNGVNAPGGLKRLSVGVNTMDSCGLYNIDRIFEDDSIDTRLISWLEEHLLQAQQQGSSTKTTSQATASNMTSSFATAFGANSSGFKYKPLDVASLSNVYAYINMSNEAAASALLTSTTQEGDFARFLESTVFDKLRLTLMVKFVPPGQGGAGPVTCQKASRTITGKYVAPQGTD